MAVQFVTEAYVSLVRIESLLLLEEVEPALLGETCPGAGTGDGSAVEVAEVGVELTHTAPPGPGSVTPPAAPSGRPLVRCVDMTASWTTHPTSSSSAPAGGGSNTNILTNINCSVTEGELIVVIGTVGSSKTSLLMTFLGELTPNMGSVEVGWDKNTPISMGYYSQEPWIMSNTIEHNILFGRPMDREWYSRVVGMCALEQDFRMMSHGDQTVIGDRGINLSGGQRARIGLARAVYGRAALNIMDDPLSAVDPHVSSQLFHAVICEALGSSTRILVTHQTQYISSPHVSRVMIMHAGRIVACDTYKALVSDPSLHSWLNLVEAEGKRRRASSAVSVTSVGSESHVEVGDAVPRSVGGMQNDQHGVISAPATDVAQSTDKSIEDTAALPEDDVANPVKKEEVEGIIVQEEKSSGSVTWGTYWKYAQFVGSSLVLAMLVVLLFANQVFNSVFNICAHSTVFIDCIIICVADSECLCRSWWWR